MKLISQIESKARTVVKSLSIHEDAEVQWLHRLVEEHPVFARLPQRVKEKLVEVPRKTAVALGNRRMRKVWKRDGVVIHAFSGSQEGYPLKRTFKEV